MRLKEKQRLPFLEAKRRALKALDTKYPTPASHIADKIWPKHEMNPQGAGGAASSILKRMENQGLTKWIYRQGSWGWIRLYP